MQIVTAGAADVYLDGELRYRTVEHATQASGEALPGIATWNLQLSARPDHLIAVRYSRQPAAASGAFGIDIGYTLGLKRISTLRRYPALQGIFTTVPVLVALLHIALFWYYPRARENLFYALSMVAFAVIVLQDIAADAGGTSPHMGLLNRLGAAAPVAAILFGLLTYYAVRTRPFPRSWVAFTVAGVVLMVACFLTSVGSFSQWSWYLYFAAFLGEIARVELSRRTVPREGVSIYLVSLALLVAMITLQVLINFRVFPSILGGGAYVFGMLASAGGMSLSLARSFASTNLHLERRLAEVQALSGQVLEQERAAHAHELRQRLLEAENARKGRELDDARTLQLSMLPLQNPEVEGLEVAVAMATASEVGGDYYDFRVGPDGSLVVTVGDATGHGVAAGIMVTAVKALFGTLGGGPSLAAMLAECDRVLRGMNVKPLHMCLTIGRVTPRSVAVCSAAMPPVLIWRASTGTVEELVSAGLPLGGGLSPAYQEHQTALAAGDTLLFATDGFAETLDPESNPLGYEGATDALRRAAGPPASEVVDRLMATAASWRREREQGDDVTFVVVRVNR
jgi:serine phosphatase RsbU (regulator of sigma subunit)